MPAFIVAFVCGFVIGGVVVYLRALRAIDEAIDEWNDR